MNGDNDEKIFCSVGFDGSSRECSEYPRYGLVVARINMKSAPLMLQDPGDDAKGNQAD